MKRFFPVFCLLIFFVNQVYAVNKINVMGLFKDRAIVELDGVRRVLVVGKKSPEGVLLISANSREAIMEINGERDRYELGNHISSEFTAPTGHKTISIAPDRGGMYIVNGTINGFQVNFIVDTGATLISMNKHEAKRLGLDYKMKGEQSLSSTAAGLVRIFLVNLSKVEVGDLVLNNVQAAVHDGDFPTVILLGNSFLNRVNMIREGKLLKLEQHF